MKQKEIPEGQGNAGLKVLLLPASVHAAQEIAAELGAQ